jgi:integrase
MSVTQLTEARVKAHRCPDGKRQEELVDASRTGLYLLTTAAGSKTYMLRYRSPETNKTAHVKVGRVDDTALAQARDKVTQLRAEISQGVDPRAEKKERTDAKSYAAYMEEDFLPMADVQKRSAKKDRQMFRDRLKSEFGHLKLSQITRKHIDQFYTALQREDLAVATCNHYVKLLRRSLNVALDWGLIERSPAQRLKLIPERNTRDRYLNDSELSKLIEVLKADANQPVARLVRWLIGTGCRLAEGMNARPEDINSEAKTWVIRADESKGGKSRTVYLSQFCLDVLEEPGGSAEWLFPNPKTEKPYTTITRVFHRLRALAGLGGDVTPHTLRHSYCTYLAQAGLNGPAIMHAMGHADFRTSNRYIHMHSGVYMQASNCVYERIGSALKKASGEN